MAGKDPTVVCSSPFKFGFYAGLGFFFASILMSAVTGVVMFVFIALLGIGTVVLPLSDRLSHQPTAHTKARAAAESIDGQ